MFAALFFLLNLNFLLRLFWAFLLALFLAFCVVFFLAFIRTYFLTFFLTFIFIIFFCYIETLQGIIVYFWLFKNLFEFLEIIFIVEPDSKSSKNRLVIITWVINAWEQICIFGRLHFSQVAKILSKNVEKCSQFEGLLLTMNCSDFLVILVLYYANITQSSFLPLFVIRVPDIDLSSGLEKQSAVFLLKIINFL